MLNLNIYAIHQVWKDSSEHTIYKKQKSHAAMTAEYISRVYIW